MAAEGNIQSEIARSLGVSVMTLHRWRKAAPVPLGEAPAASAGANYEARMVQLQAENMRLRRLVTDLLLETMQLQETAEQSDSYAEERRRVAQ